MSSPDDVLFRVPDSPTGNGEENRYFVCLSDHDHPMPWTLESSHRHVPAYVNGVLRHAASLLDYGGWTFYVTWRLDTLPETGPNVIAIVMGDEWARVPRYANQIGATFKCYGIHLPIGTRTPWKPSYINMLLWTKYLRTQVHRLADLFQSRGGNLEHGRNGERPTGGIYDFPLGYGNQVDLPIQPILDRPHDLFFAGSVEHAQYPIWSPKYWLQTPKAVSRHRMIEELGALSRQHSDIRVKLSTTSEFAWNAVFYGKRNTEGLLDAEAYSAQMMNTKICLVPRGTSPETFRFFEALRYGCIPITEALPDRWFYRDAPAIVVDDWKELGDLVPALLASPHRLETLHENARNWWHRVCSEAAVGQHVADILNALPASSRPASSPSPLASS